MACNCEGKTYNIGMGCCVPVLAPIENYYTKWETERYVSGYTYSKEEIDEKTSGETSGCCITPEEVDERIASAKTEIEAEIPSLDGYSTTEEMNTAINQSVSGKANASDVQALSGEVQTISAATSDDVTSGEVENMIAAAVSVLEAADSVISGAVDDLSSSLAQEAQRASSAETVLDTKINGKQNQLTAGTGISIENDVISVTATSPTVDAYTKAESDAKFATITNFNSHSGDTNVHVTASEKSTWNNKSDFSGNYNDLTNKPTIPNYTAGSGITITNNVISAKIWSGTKAQYDAITTKDADTIYLIYNS